MNSVPNNVRIKEKLTLEGLLSLTRTNKRSSCSHTVSRSNYTKFDQDDVLDCPEGGGTDPFRGKGTVPLY